MKKYISIFQITILIAIISIVSIQVRSEQSQEDIDPAEFPDAVCKGYLIDDNSSLCNRLNTSYDSLCFTCSNCTKGTPSPWMTEQEDVAYYESSEEQQKYLYYLCNGTSSRSNLIVYVNYLCCLMIISMLFSGL